MFKKNHSQPSRSLENEVILAVVVLYLLLAIVMTVVHYIQPAEQETITSSTSPSHNEKNSRQIKE
ncbi:MAG: hypothetical protein ACREUM_00020 [Nitrosospira sp.]|jgi:hypothetical protein